MNAADPKQVAKAGREAKRRAYRASQDLRWVLGDERGRRVMQGLLEALGLFQEVKPGRADTLGNQALSNFAIALRAEIKRLDPRLPAAMEAEFDSPADEAPEELDAHGQADDD